MKEFFAKVFIAGILGAGIFGIGYFIIPEKTPIMYSAQGQEEETAQIPATGAERREPQVIVSHIATPKQVKAIYMTSWVAGTSAWRTSLVGLIEKTELNSIVIDIKDYSGRIAFLTDDPLINSFGATEERVTDIKEFIGTLHDKGIYVIGRITVFQDPHLAAKKPEWAVKKESNKGENWKDYKGLAYIDPGARGAWEYTARLAKESYAVGFDELNFDYIRFPSDGPMQDIYFPQSEEQIVADWHYGKAKVIRDFFRYLHGEMDGTGAVLSADLFGMVTTNTDDLNIGQVLEYALPYFDYIAPMVYPSHYPKGFNGWENPNRHVYDVVKYSMSRAATRLKATTTPVAALGGAPVASTTPQLYEKSAYDTAKLRPWLQDFDYGGNYDIAEVRAQIQAVYDSGLDSWMLWDPANKYTEDALFPR